MIDFVVDENVQIHGGNGFVRDYPAEGMDRDARVNRIFEGTNEINRLLIPGMLAKRAVKGTLPIIAAARALQDELLSPTAGTPGDGPLDAAWLAVTGMKKTALMVLGTAMQTYGDRLSEEQEVLTRCADVIIDVYASESVLLRAGSATPLHTPRSRWCSSTMPRAASSCGARRAGRHGGRRHAPGAHRGAAAADESSP